MEARNTFDIVIVGGGVIGSSIAFHLTRKLGSSSGKCRPHAGGARSIALMDLDLEGRYSSSELNAGGIRAEWWHTINIELTRATLEFLKEDPEQFGFRQKGYLWLYDEKGWKSYQAHAAVFREQKLDIEELTPQEAQKRVPCIDRLEGIVGGTFSPNDGIFNSNLLKNYFRGHAKEKGTVFIDGASVKAITQTGAYLEILYDDIRGVDGSPPEHEVLHILSQRKSRGPQNLKKIRCAILVNAAGAWAATLAKLYGHDVPCQPVRRQISIFDCKELDLSPYGMIVDTSGVYFHAEAEHILAGYATPDEPTGFNFKYDGEPFFEQEIWPRLMKRMSAAEALKHIRGWAGLYSQTPDRSGIMGRVTDPRVTDSRATGSRVDSGAEIYEAHSFTGRGVMQSYGVGLAMAELILDGGYRTIHAEGLHPDRFRLPSGKLLYEGFHI